MNETLYQEQESEEAFWQAVLDRDSTWDHKIYYGVRSTKIYCRPSCPSRKPKRDRVLFFRSSAEAEQAGFRPCQRCHPQQNAIDPMTEKILLVCRYLEAQTDRIPTLLELSDHVQMSANHLQKWFKQIMGITPFQYGNALRIDRLKHALQEGESIANSLYAVGYGSSSRLYEKAPEQLGMTPATYKNFGRGETIHYTIAQSSLGYLLVATTPRGICSVRLADSIAILETEFKQEFRHATLEPADSQLSAWTQAIVHYLSGTLALPNLPFDVKATAFQLQVWDALRSIPPGKTITYSQLAATIGQPTAVRAVARACATNPIALVIPCHRVVPKTGGYGGYRWGISRKQALIELEKQL